MRDAKEKANDSVGSHTEYRSDIIWRWKGFQFPLCLHTSKYNLVSSSTSFFQALPLFGLSSSTFLILSIGIDRFISMSWPLFYLKKNAGLYLLVSKHLYGSSLPYSGASHSNCDILFFPDESHNLLLRRTVYFLFFLTSIDCYDYRSTMCDVPDVYHIQSKFQWAVSFCSVYITALLLYIYIWSKLVRNGQ